MIDHAEDSNAVERRIFAVDNTDICSFTAVPNFTINLTSFLLNILNLENTEQSNTARVPARLPTATRQQLYIHSNIVEGHLINNDEQQLLRVINNSAQVGEKVMLSFPYLQYYLITRRYITSIRTHITDNYTSDTLLFSKPVLYLLRTMSFFVTLEAKIDEFH